MRFISTRGMSPAVSAPEALLNGIASDGGLYLPDSLPDLGHLAGSEMDYPGLAAEVFRALLPGFSAEALDGAARAAYTGTFDAPEATPLIKAGPVHVLELFHGPTAAFKDLALQALPRLLSLAREDLAPGAEVLVLTATSGDTGSAAMRGFQGLPGFRVLVYYPENGVSPVQRMQMVSMPGDNLRAVGIRGDFDTAQAGVKAVFALGGEGLPAGLRLSSANSINVGRLVPQVVYYAHACRELLRRGEAKPGEAIDFVVPTGNFGDIFAGYLAKRMGLPVGKLVCASNANRVLADFLQTGVYDRRRPLNPTLSPSMDILVSSNLERLLYLSSGGDAALVRGLMDSLRERGWYQADGGIMAAVRESFTGAWADDARTLDAIRETWETHRYLLDPHTAAAWSALPALGEAGRPRVVLSTASPFKFPEAVFKALGMPLPGESADLPARLAEALGLPLPEPLRGLKGRPVLHRDVVGKDEIVRDALRRAASW